MCYVHVVPHGKLKPDKVYYVGGFGVLSKWLPVSEYEVSCGTKIQYPWEHVVNKCSCVMDDKHKRSVIWPCKNI